MGRSELSPSVSLCLSIYVSRARALWLSVSVCLTLCGRRSVGLQLSYRCYSCSAYPVEYS